MIILVMKHRTIEQWWKFREIKKKEKKELAGSSFQGEEEEGEEMEMEEIVGIDPEWG